MLKLVYQHLVGHFQVECRILDGDRVMGVGIVELEVLFNVSLTSGCLPLLQFRGIQKNHFEDSERKQALSRFDRWSFRAIGI